MIVCVSDLVAADVTEVVQGSAEVRVIPNAIDTTVLRPPTPDERSLARARLGVGDQPVLLWAGRVTASKLPITAAEAGRRFEGTMLMLGDGPMLVQIPRDDPTVRVLGYRNDVLTAYHAADVFLFTSTGAGEGAPFAILEAAACGLPIVVNEGSGLAYLASAMGALVADNDATALAEAADRAVGVSGATSRDWATRNDIALWATQHLDVMRTLASER